MKRVKKLRILAAFTAVLFCFLAVAAVMVTRQQQGLLRDNAYHQAEHDLQLMAAATLEILLKSDYATVRTFVERWGETHREFREIRAVAPNGYVIAEYRNRDPYAGEQYALSQLVSIGNRKLATIHLVGDFHSVDLVAIQLRNRLFAGAFIITVLLVVSVWLVFRKMAMMPFETVVEERTRALSVANLELEQEMAVRQRAEESLRERETRISSILNSVAEGIYGVDLKGDCTFINAAALRILGFEREEDVLGKNIHRLIHHTRPDGSRYDAADCKVYRCYRTREGCHVDDEVFWRQNGTCFPVEYWAQPVLYSGSPTGAVTAFVDITSRKETEEKVRKSEERLHLVLESSTEGFIAVSSTRNIVMTNKKFAELWRMPQQLIDSADYAAILDWLLGQLADAETFRAKVEKLRNTDITDRDVIALKDGRTFEMYSAPMLSDGTVVGRLWSSRDITDRHKLEDQLRQVQKMESVGTLAGGIAHDFNNILSAIVGYGHIMLMKMRPDDPQKQNIRHILTAADRATYLTQGLLAFSRKQMSNKRPIDLNEIMKKTDHFLRRIIGEDIEFITNQHDGALMVFVDPNQIEQVMMNLATNARDAMPGGGVLTVTLERVTLDESFSRKHGFGKPGRYGMMTVSDTGIGMSEEIQKRMFEPFFTTKDVGKGTGLGLAIIYGIVKQHNGFITVESTPNKGTTFRMYLPVIDTAAPEADKSDETLHSVEGSETVLLAEDEAPLRELMESVFREFGYQVIVAVDGDDAVRKFSEHQDRIHLFISDLIMPKKNGKEAYDEIRLLRPGIKAVFMSGYSPDIVRHKTALDHDATIIYKPISPIDLLKKVRSVLDGTVG